MRVDGAYDLLFNKNVWFGDSHLSLLLPQSWSSLLSSVHFLNIILASTKVQPIFRQLLLTFTLLRHLYLKNAY